MPERGVPPLPYTPIREIEMKHHLVAIVIALSFPSMAFSAEGEQPAPGRPSWATAEDINVRITQVPPEYYIGEPMEAILEIQNVSERRIMFRWKTPEVSDLAFYTEDHVAEIERITVKPTPRREGARAPTIIQPKMAWRGRVFIDSYLDFQGPLSQPITLDWKFSFPLIPEASKSGKIVIMVKPKRSDIAITERVKEIVERLNAATKVEDNGIVADEIYSEFSQINASVVVDHILSIENRQYLLRALGQMHRFRDHPKARDIARDLTASSEAAYQMVGINLCAQMHILLNREEIGKMLKSDNKDVQASVIVYVGRIMNELCLREIAEKTQDPYLPVADSAGRVMLMVNPKLPLQVIDAGADPFGNPIVPLPSLTTPRPATTPPPAPPIDEPKGF